LIICVAVALTLRPVRADVIVGDGATMTLGDGTLAMGCMALRITGTLHGASGTVELGGDYEIQSGGLLAGEGGTFEVAGDWSNQGTFDPGGSTVHFLDGCGNAEARICNSSTFANLIVESDTGKIYEFEAGATQTVLDSLVIAGDQAALVRIQSKSDGDRAFIDLQGDQEISFVDVRDHEAVGRRIAPGAPEDFGSIDSGNTRNWFFNIDALPAPAATTSALLVALLAMTLVAGWRLRRFKREVRT
jgi:hypothetical protein